jgi:hypothetical protein
MDLPFGTVDLEPLAVEGGQADGGGDQQREHQQQPAVLRQAAVEMVRSCQRI